MRKWVELKFSDDADKLNRIAYIDGEHLYTTPSTADLNAYKAANAEEGKDVIWTIPANSGGIVAMDEGKADLGQPVYINGLFMGSEFPAAQNKIELANATATTEAGTRLAISRYYTGKNLGDLERDDHFLNQLTDDNKFVAWQTVVGASRSDGKDQSIVQQDFFSYIRDISTPSEFRIQYNSWYDNMMRITDDNIMEAFKDIDKNFVKTGVRPLDSYVVDDGWNVYRKTSSDLQGGIDIERNGQDDVNTAGFWQFNSKFPNELYTSSEYVQKMGSYFGVWIGPRGGYNYQGMLADIIQTGVDTDGDGVKDTQYGSSAGGSIDVADSRYVKKFAEMAVDWTNRFKVNYWKWDGFADSGQYGAFSKGSIETVGYSGSNQHMYGGPNGEYHVTDLWEKWIYIMEEARGAAAANGIDNLWISLTCYTHPSAWFLQWANSVWIQCVMDRGESANTVLRDKLNTMLTYRDAVYHNFIVDHEFQFPLSNIYNHDPIYGKEDTGINADTMDGEQFRNHLFMQSGRGTAFWELYYSDSILNDEKYLINADYLEWAEANYELLKHAIMVGDSPDDQTTLTTGNNGNATQQSAYGFANFSETEADGILSMRNPAAVEKTFTVKLDESIGVRFDEEYTMWKEHVYLQSEGQTAATHLVNGVAATNNILHKGDTVSITLQPGEVQIWHLKKGGDTTAPALDQIYFNDANTIQVRASERLNNTNITFTVNGKTVPAENVTKYADLRTFIITLDEEMVDGSEITVATANGTDNAGNPLTGSISAKYYENNTVVFVRKIRDARGTLSSADRSIVGGQGFAVSAEVVYAGDAVELLKQGDSYVLGINAEGKPYFSVNGLTATSDMVMTEGKAYRLSGIRENNGYVRLYIDNQIDKAAYDKAYVGTVVEAAPITYATGNNTLKNVLVNSAALAYDEVPESPLKVDSSVFVVDQDAKSITVNNAKTTAGELLAGLVYEDDVTVVAKRRDMVLPEDARVAEGDIVTVSVAGETASYTILVEATYVAEKIPQSNMIATAGSAESSAEQNPASNAIDGDPATIWHTSWTSVPTAEQKWITVELTEDYLISGYEYTPRRSSNNGNITSYEIYTSNTNNGSDWELAASGNNWANDSSVKTVIFEEPVQAKYVKLFAVEGAGDFASAAEINLYGERVYPSDKEQPSAPVLTVNEVAAKTVELSWTESNDGVDGSGVSEYYLKQNGEEIVRFNADAREYVVGGLQPETTYSFEIVAVDKAGNEAGSEVIEVTTGMYAEVAGYTLTLEGNIGVNYHMQLGENVLADEGAYMKFTLGNKELEPIYVKDIEPTVVDDVAYYVFKCEVPVKDMQTEITGQIFLSNGRSSSEFKYTVKEYADKIGDKIDKGEILPDASEKVVEATVELVESMSNFGDYASTYFEKETLAETEEMQKVTSETLEAYEGAFATTDSYYGSSLLLKADTIIRHYFKEEVTVPDGYTGGNKDGLYYIESQGIPAHELGKEIVTTVGDMEITYSPLSYAYIVLSRDDIDENLKSVARAMYLYYEAASAYKEATQN